MKNSQIIAVITARKNSKSIKNKNMIKIDSKPLIKYSIDICKKSKYINKTILSSDSDEMINYCLKNKVDVLFKRPRKFSNDYSTDLDVFTHLVNFFSEKNMELPKFFIHVRPTCPIRKVETFDKAINLFNRKFKNGYTSLRSVSLSNENPYKMWNIENNLLNPIIKNNKYKSVPRQLIPKSYWQNGYIDIITPQTILKGSMEGNKILPYVIKEFIHDIDYLSDLKNFKTYMKNKDKEIEDRSFPS